MSNIQSDLYLAFTDSPTPKVNFLHWLALGSGLPDELRLLDIGCGPGHMLPFYKGLGWHVVGLEPDPGFYEAAQARATEYDFAIKKGGFSNNDYKQEFDLITAINGPFAYLLSVKEQKEALESCFRALKPGGVLFLEIPNFLWHLKNNNIAQDAKSVVHDNEVHFKRTYDIDFHDATVTIHNRYEWHVPTGTESVSRDDIMGVMTVPHLLGQLRQSGFSHSKTFSDYDSRKPSRVRGRDILISGRKPLTL